MEEERSEYTSTSTIGLDSHSLIQLLQNNNDIRERGKRRSRWKSPLAISVMILYGIVAILVLQQVLRNNRSDMGYDVKKLQEDVAYLKMQNMDLLTKLHMSMNVNRNQSIINNDKYFKSQELRVSETNIESSGMNESALKEHIKNVTQEFENQFILVRNQLNTSFNIREQKFERLFDRLSEKVMQKVSKNQSIQELLIKGSNESSSSMDFIIFKKLIFKTLGGSEKESGVMLKAMKNNIIREMRSCYDYKRLGITENGFYDINLGNPPSSLSSVRVFCNFTTNSTYLYHNSIEGANVTACEGDACFQYNLTYSASLDQIKVLIDNSRHCQQSIRFRCYHASLKNYGAWYDSSGEKQSYFTGSNYGEHLCQCHNSTDGCRGLPSVNKCNCDASLLPVWLEDVGNITNKTALPISRFTYGHLYSGGGQKAFIQVGPLNCTGENNDNKKVDAITDVKEREKIMAKLQGSYISTYGISYSIYNRQLTINRAGVYLIYCIANDEDFFHHNFCEIFGDKEVNIKFYATGTTLSLYNLNLDYSFQINLLMEI